MIENKIKALFFCDQEMFSKQNTMFEFSSFRFFLLIFGVGCLLFCRRPEALLEPQFFAEDGTVFFKDAYELTFLSSVMKTYAGYYHIIPRVFAEVASLFPIRFAPILYNLFSLIIAAVSISLIWLPHFRHLIRSDFARLLLVLLFILLPNQEALMKLTYIQCYVLLFLALCSFMLPIKNLVAMLVLMVISLLFIWTSPTSFVLLPVWAVRVFFSDRSHKFMNAVLILSSLTMVGLYAYNYIISEVYTNTNIDSVYLLNGLCNAFLYKVICSGIFGPDITYCIFVQGWKYIYAMSFLSVFLILRVWFYTNWKMPALIITTMYISLASASIFVLRTSYVISFIHGEGVRVHDRYFFLPTALFLLTIFFIVAQYYTGLNNSKRNKFVPGLILLFWILFSLPSFKRSWTPIDFGWSKYAEQIEVIQERAAVNTQTYILKIPVNPIPWTIDLNIYPPDKLVADVE